MKLCASRLCALNGPRRCNRSVQTVRHIAVRASKPASMPTATAPGCQHRPPGAVKCAEVLGAESATGAVSAGNLSSAWPRSPSRQLPLTALSVIPGLSLPLLAELAGDLVFQSALWAWGLAQFFKVFTFSRSINIFGGVDWRYIKASGGMPSSHSSLVTGVVAGIALKHGLTATGAFPAALAFSLIVMYDASHVRQEAGKHAKALNDLISTLPDDHKVSDTPKFKEVIGHSSQEVVGGGLLGVATAFLFSTLSQNVLSIVGYTGFAIATFTIIASRLMNAVPPGADETPAAGKATLRRLQKDKTQASVHLPQ